MNEDLEYFLAQVTKWMPKYATTLERAYAKAEMWYQGFQYLLPLFEEIEQEMKETDLALAQWADDGGPE